MENKYQFSLGLVNTKLVKLFDKYHSISKLPSTVTELCKQSRAFKASFTNCLEYDIAIIEARSQNLDDHEISLIQKAFVSLMNQDHSQLAGIALYVEEILGFRSTSLEGKENALIEFVKAKDFLAKSTTFFYNLLSSRCQD